MTVAELIKELQLSPPDKECVLVTLYPEPSMWSIDHVLDGINVVMVIAGDGAAL